MRQIAKSLIIRSGGLSLYHRLKHREALTVLMFHRVLPQSLITAYDADQGYSVSTSFLEGLVPFIQEHYTIVSLSDVISSRNKRTPLPSHPLLITFDDGWNDNAIFAAPIFAKKNVPWVLFVATSAMDSGPHWWQETLLSALRSGAARYETLKSAALRVAQDDVRELPDDPELSILLLYGTLPPAHRDNLIDTYCGSSGSRRPRDMANWNELHTLHRAGVGIGGHGNSHLPLTMVADPRCEIAESKRALEEKLGLGECITMSFPHGRYDASLAAMAREQGMQLLFTSDPVLNKCPGGWLESDMVGRISISMGEVASPRGELSPDRLMPWLILRSEA